MTAAPRAPRFTLDSNVLVCVFDGGDRRREAAEEILARAARRPCVLTAQSLGEFFFATTRKGILPRAAAAEQVRRWLVLFPSPAMPTPDCIPFALEAAAAGRLGYWDAMLLATAAAASCAAVISEDMADGATLGTVRVVRAFQGTAVSPAALALLEGRSLLDTPPPAP